MLTYPNIVPETFCIAVREALAAGCAVVTGDLGALPETSVGWATLVPAGGGREEFRNRFTAATVAVLRQWAERAPALERHLRRQVAHVHRYGTWAGKADAWRQWWNDGVVAGAVSRRTLVASP